MHHVPHAPAMSAASAKSAFGDSTNPAEIIDRHGQEVLQVFWPNLESHKWSSRTTQAQPSGKPASSNLKP